MSNQTDDRIQRLDLIEQTWLGLIARLQSVFAKNSGICGRDIEVIPTADPDDFEYLQQQKGSTLELPMIVLSPSQVQPDSNSYNANVMRRIGMTMEIDSDRKNYTAIRAVPVLMTYQVTMVTDDALTMMRMISRFLATEIWSFELAFSDWKAKIQILVEKNMTVPPRQVTQGGGRQFRLTTTMQAKTYSGYVWKVPAIRKIQLDALFPISGSIEAAMENPEILANTVYAETITSNPWKSPNKYEPEA